MWFRAKEMEQGRNELQAFIVILMMITIKKDMLLIKPLSRR